ncbi:RluA family pseudouridine synthase [Lachnospiraceae bacterium ZAX-1]
MTSGIDILYEDGDIIVCHKQSGIPVQTPKSGQMDMVSLLKNYRAGRNEVPEIFLIHRLDQPVEGVMVFAKAKGSADDLNRQLQRNRMDKYYWAVTDIHLEEPTGVRKDYLLKNGKTNTSSVVPSNTVGAKRAELSYRVVAQNEKQDLVEICLETGRHHQIRVQMAHFGYPILGDKKYNPNCKETYEPIALCSVRLSFLHPKSKKKMEFHINPKGEIFKGFEIKNSTKDI